MKYESEMVGWLMAAVIVPVIVAIPYFIAGLCDMLK